jgi:hypothetical protein
MKYTPLALLMGLLGCARPSPADRLAGDEAVAAEAVRMYVERGAPALAELGELSKHDDPLVRRRARTAIGRITGQWGSDTGLVWKRSMADATGRDKPIVLLHLFGEFDKEFC